MPRNLTFNAESVLDAALDLARKEGIEALSARAVAARLGASTAPVYSAFSSMESLKEALLDEALELLDASVERRYTEGRFLNQGVGFAVFARDEPRLFLALFDAGEGSLLERYRAGLVDRLFDDPALGRLERPAIERIAGRMWTYTVGLAFCLARGRRADASTGAILAELRSSGSVAIYGELRGVADYGSAEAREAWAELVARKGLDIELKPLAERSEAN